MNYDKARQRKDLNWDYTTANDGFIRPIGYCAGWNWSEAFDPDHDWAWGNADHWQADKNDAETFKHKYHTNGHTTQQEARDCYKEFELDNSLRLDRVTSSTMHKCQVCETWTQRLATIGPWISYHLCDNHCNRENVAKLYSVGESWHS